MSLLARRLCISVAMVNIASPLELRAVSTESCTTPMIKPTATTCIATSLLMPKSEQAIGMSNNEPPATPEAPQAAKVATILSNKALPKETSTPKVLQVAKVITVIVTAAPFIFMVQPSGKHTE